MDPNDTASDANAQATEAGAPPEELASLPTADPSPGETSDAPSATGQAGAAKPDGDGEADSDRQTDHQKGDTAKLIRRLKGKLKAAETARDALQKAAETALKRAEAAATPAKPEPRQEDFGTYEEYVDALVSHRVEQRLAAERSASDAEAGEAPDLDEIRAQAEHTAATDAWAEQVADVKTRHPDFEQKVLDPALPITAPMADVLMRAEDGAEVAYYLAAHPEVCAEIASLPDPVSIALAIGQVSATRGLSPAAPPVEQQASVPSGPGPASAAPVIEPVSSAGRGGVPNPERMTTDDWMRWRNGALTKR